MMETNPDTIMRLLRIFGEETYVNFKGKIRWVRRWRGYLLDYSTGQIYRGVVWYD